MNEVVTDTNRKKWYLQILRLRALVHDLGHTPYSHASEDVLPKGIKHEDFTERIVINTEVGNFIREIGQEMIEKTGNQNFDITPELNNG